jgi:hypothetical protein
MSGRTRIVVAALIATLFVAGVVLGALMAIEYLLAFRVVALLESLDILPPDWAEGHPDTISLACLVIALVPTIWFGAWFFRRAARAEEAVERGEL